ncbi:hypothetical protein KDW_11160 [Dictyobacter vulcani]|uniref:Winged helix DNA-binding domain-containing protein n=1 Tax=Dictyobacter vulcani TaxID=2607529 RepID=A0A5J4KD90_9CHLR|nr:winged helix DNA-binding domain-containing protein [Dictyobacter vulcani]GER86954.1 hypothetical protein KDW_11160 [Dictyobacter vulcani]
MDIAHQRLFNQRIDSGRFERPEDVVRWMGAMQAQDYQASLWAIGLRTQAATLADVEQAVCDRKILRTWPMRGTLHFVPAEDAKWMLALSAVRMLGRDKRRQELLELNEQIIERARELFVAALQGGERLTRPDAMQLLEDAGISTKGQRGYHLLWYLSQSGTLCMGPMEKKQQTFVLLDEWVLRPREFSREEALAEFVFRYITSHGPATIQDFAWWAGLTLTEAKAGFESVKSKFQLEKINGQSYWIAADAPSRDEYLTSSLHLLPGFDEYLLGYKDRSAVLAAEHTFKIVPGNNGVFMPTMVASGQVTGIWKRTLKKNAIEIQLQPFIQSGDAETETNVSEAARRYSAFLNLPLSATTIQPVII